MSGTLRDFVDVTDGWAGETAQESEIKTDSGAGKENGSSANNQPLKLPSEMGILPIRNAVVYPGTVSPLAVGREKSKALLKDIRPNDTIIGILTQRKPDTDEPDFADLYRTGTASTVLKILRAQIGRAHV